VFQEGASLEAQMAKMSPIEAHAFGLKMLQHTLEPYKYIIFVLIGILVLFILTKYPACKPVVQSTKNSKESPGIIQTLKYLGGNGHLRFGLHSTLILKSTNVQLQRSWYIALLPSL
jgi:FHS family L-fucose permease-like MFS transporter